MRPLLGSVVPGAWLPGLWRQGRYGLVPPTLQMHWECPRTCWVGRVTFLPQASGHSYEQDMPAQVLSWSETKVWTLHSLHFLLPPTPQWYSAWVAGGICCGNWRPPRIWGQVHKGLLVSVHCGDGSGFLPLNSIFAFQCSCAINFN